MTEEPSSMHLRLVLPPKAQPAIRLAAEAVGKAAALLTALSAKPGKREIVTRIEKSLPEAVGDEGFMIQTETPDRIAVRALTSHGAANGLFALAREMRQSPELDPFSRKWSLAQSPRFARRGVWVLHFLPQYTHLTIDGFTLDDWRQYIDFLREWGANSITLLTVKLYHPEVPETERYRPFYETTRQAMQYAQSLGMKFAVVFPQNLVPSEIWWKNPDLRPQTWGYYGINLCPTAGRDEIRKAQKPFFEFFKGADEMGYMFADGGADCHCPQCKDRRADAILESLEMGRDLLQEVNSKANLVAFTWMIRGEMLDRLLKEADPRIEVVDTALTLGPAEPGEGVLSVAKRAGRKVTNFIFVTDPEGGMELECSVFPWNKLEEIQKEIAASERANLDGIVAYRMAPPVRFIGDAAALRWAWDPSLAASQVVTEIAAAAVSDPEHRQLLHRGIFELESFWRNFGLDAIREADALFRSAAESALIPQMRHTADGVSVLSLLAEKALDEANAVPLVPAHKATLWERMCRCPIYQGYTTDLAWVGKSQMTLLYPMIDLWAAYLRDRRTVRRKQQQQNASSEAPPLGNSCT